MSSCSSDSSIELSGLNRIVGAMYVWTSPKFVESESHVIKQNKMHCRIFIDNDEGIESPRLEVKQKVQASDKSEFAQRVSREILRSISDFYTAAIIHNQKNHNGEKEKGILCWSGQGRCRRRLEQAHKDAHQDVRRCGGLRRRVPHQPRQDHAG